MTYSNTTKTVFILLTACLFLGSYSSVHAAYCSLRDPISAINKLYPNATHHQSITREVNRESRQMVSQRLPFTLLFNELGKHTLYVVMDEKTPLGFIHARSELSDFGLIEIVWAINPDMTIRDSYFQRCRNKKCRDATFIADIKNLVNNKGFNELQRLIPQESPAQENLAKGKGFAKSHADLKQAIIKSALKTIAVTESVWSDDISQAQRQQLAFKKFNQHASLDLVPIESISHRKMQFNMVYPSSIKAYNIVSNDENLGMMVYAKWEQYGYDGAFHWVFSKDGTVLDIQPSQPWPNAEIAHEFQQTLGKNVSNKELCNSATELTGKKLFRLGRRH